MMTLAFIDQVGGWWNELTLTKQLFFGIGIFATLLSLFLTALSFLGADHHEGMDTSGLSHDGMDVLSIKPLTAFFLAFGWTGGIALDNGLSMFAALGVAILAGAALMGVVIAMFRGMYALRSDGTMNVKNAVGAVGTVYVTVPAHRATGGQVVVNFSGRQETFVALSGAASPIASGEKVKVVSLVDGRTVVVEAL